MNDGCKPGVNIGLSDGGANVADSFFADKLAFFDLFQNIQGQLDIRLVRTMEEVVELALLSADSMPQRVAGS